MTDPHPRVSVCIPVYNGAMYIAEAITSVLGQTFGDFELVVADNRSTDGTAEIVRQFRDPRIVYVRNPTNLGLVGNHNRCLELARGEYVNIWHHDDVMFPENLASKVRVLDSHANVGFVHSNILRIDASGQGSEEHWATDSRFDYVERGDTFVPRYLRRMVAYGSLVFIGAVLARRECYRRFGGFRNELYVSCDDEMWMRLALYWDVACLGAPLVKYRIHAGSATTAARGFRALQQHYLASRIILDEHRHRLPGAARLREEVLSAFGRRAFLSAVRAFEQGNAKLAWAYFRLGLEAYPRLSRYPGMALRWGFRKLLPRGTAVHG